MGIFRRCLRAISALPITLAIVTFAALISAAPALAQKRVALVVGNNAYANLAADKQLNNAVSDARLMRSTLQGLGFEVLYGENLDRRALVDRLFDLTSRLGKDDTAFFFFAGHGVSFSGANYLLPSDVPAPRASGRAEEGRLAEQAIAEATVIERLTGAGARVAIVVLDACRDNPLQAIDRRSVGATRGLAQSQPGRGVFAIYSAGFGQTALDRLGSDDRNPNSVFTRVFIEKLKTPGLDLRAVAAQTRGIVVELAQKVGHDQFPAYYDQVIGGDVYLAGLPLATAPVAQSTPAQPQPDPAAQAWTATQNTNSIAVLEDFIRQFGATVYGSMARARLDELKMKQVAAVTPPQQQQQQIQQPTPTPTQPQTQSSSAATTELVYLPWTKLCTKGPETNARQICFTGKDARNESGQPVVAAVLIEPEGDPKKILRVTLPLGMQMKHGTRAIIDKGQPASAPYVVCFANGCIADYEANADMINRLKRGQQLAVEAIQTDGKPANLKLPIGGEFAKAHDGAPTDPKVFQAQQKKLQEELERRAAASGKKMDRSAEATAAPPVNPGDLTNLTYSPWTKLCTKGPEANAKQICFTGKDARNESGQPVVAAVLIEPEGDPKKILRVTLPLGMQMKHGTRAIIDKGQPASAPYVVCFANGCIADYEANADMINRLKRGQQLAVEAIQTDGKPASLKLPIGGEFAKAHDGAPTDPKVAGGR